MRKTFEINSEPHVAEIGDVELLFEPQVSAADFLGAYDRVRATAEGARAAVESLQSAGADAVAAGQVDLSSTVDAINATRELIGSFLTRASRDLFFGVPSLDASGAQIGWEVEPLRLSDQVLGQLVEFLMEAYGRRPTGLPSGSPAPSSKTGTRSRASSSSKGSGRRS